MYRTDAAQKMKFCIKDFFSKYEQMHSFLRILFLLLQKSLMEIFSFMQCDDIVLVSLFLTLTKCHIMIQVCLFSIIKMLLSALFHLPVL